MIDNIKDLSFTASERYLNIIFSSRQKTLTLLDNLWNWIRFQTTEITFKPNLRSL